MLLDHRVIAVHPIRFSPFSWRRRKLLPFLRRRLRRRFIHLSSFVRSFVAVTVRSSAHSCVKIFPTARRDGRTDAGGRALNYCRRRRARARAACFAPNLSEAKREASLTLAPLLMEIPHLFYWDSAACLITPRKNGLTVLAVRLDTRPIHAAVFPRESILHVIISETAIME